MADSTDKGDKDKERPDELDLSGLQNFNFAENWSESPAVSSRRERGSDRSHAPRHDRRPDRRPPPSARQRRPVEERGSRGGAPGDRRGRSERSGPRERRPAPDQQLWRESPFEIQVFPDEPILATLTRAMRQSLRTYELFEIARLVLEKPERFHLSIRFKDGEGGPRPLFQSVPDDLPFVSEEAAVDHVLRTHAEKLFRIEEVEVEPPKGSFQFITRCTLTGDFLSPPNYHRYQALLLQYHQDHFPDMPFERFRSHIETVKDEEAIQRWMEGMTRQNRYHLGGEGDGEGESFDSLEQAKAHLLRQAKDSVVRSVKTVKIGGRKVGEISDSNIRPYVESCIQHQQRFPLDTANALRGRLRRQNFFIYKKGSRGISYVCAVRRKFRQPGQVFSPSVEALIGFIAEHEMIPASQLPDKFLELPPRDPEDASPRDPEAEEKVKRLTLDLRWLLSEGYVTEFSDGRLAAHIAPPERVPKDSGSGKKQEDAGEAPEQPAPEQPAPEQPAPEQPAPDQPEGRADAGEKQEGSPAETPADRGEASGETESSPEETPEGSEEDVEAAVAEERQHSDAGEK